MSMGNITRRGRNSWRVKYELPRDPETGERRIAYVTVRGKRADAEKELRARLYQIDKGVCVDPSRITVGEYLDQWLSDVAPTSVGAKALERYGEIAENQIKPRLGKIEIQKLRPANIKSWHGELLHTGLSRRTVRQAHQILRKALGDAAATELVERNVASLIKPPTVQRSETAILTADHIGCTLDKLEGHWLHPIATLAFATGLRRGEIMALRWSDVELNVGTLRVDRSLEQTRAGLAFKSPKTAAGRRKIGLPSAAVEALRGHLRTTMELHLALGLGRMPDCGLVFGNPDGSPRSPHSVSNAWGRAVKRLDLPNVTFHALRHSHASALIAGGMDVVSVSRRLGHGSPAVTLSVYGHLFTDKDKEAVTLIDDVLGTG